MPSAIDNPTVITRRRQVAQPPALNPDLVACARDLRKKALGLARNTADAEDLVQDTVVKALLHAAEHGALPENLHGWMSKVLYTIFIDHCRFAYNRTSMRGDDAFWATVGEAYGHTPDHDTRLTLIAAYACLNAYEQQVFGHVDVLGLTNKEYAEQSGLPFGTVLTHSNRVRAKMRKLLETAWGP